MTTYVSSASGRGLNWNATLTTTQFQPWAVRVKAALDGCGLVQTSDTGQMNPATATWPGTGSTDAGYLIYRFADAQQGTDPVFLKFRLGRGGAQYETRLMVDVGQGSNGSGTLTGTTAIGIPVGTSYETSVNIDPATVDYSCHTDGYFCLFKDAIAANGTAYYRARHWMTIERTRNQTTGAFDGSGVVVHTCSTNKYGASATSQESSQYYVDWVDGLVASIGSNGDPHFCLPVSNVSATDSGTLIAWPHFYRDGDVIKTCWAKWTADVSTFGPSVNTIVASPYGVSHTWLVLGAPYNIPYGIGLAQGTWGMIFLWE